MPSKSYLPAEPDAIGFADALDHDEVIDTSPVPGNVNTGQPIRDQVQLQPTPTANNNPPAPAPAPAFTPSFGAPQPITTSAPPRTANNAPASLGGTGLPSDPVTLQKTRAKLKDTGTTYAPNQAAPTHPEPQKTTIEEAPPTIGSMVTVPEFAKSVYGDAAPDRQKPEPLMNHPRNQNAEQAKAPAPPVKVAAPPPPVVQPAPAPAPAPAPKPVAAAPAPTTPPPSDQAVEIPKNAKKVVTTTTTTTKIVDGKEVTETHVHHNVVVKKKGFGVPKFLKNLGGKPKKTTTTTTTTATEQQQ